jgi:hypothetical protein
MRRQPHALWMGAFDSSSSDLICGETLVFRILLGSFLATDVIKILVVIAGLVLIVFPVWWLEKTAVPLPQYRKGGSADYVYLVFAMLAIYGSVLFGIAVQFVRAKRTMQPLHPFALFKAGLGGVLAVIVLSPGHRRFKNPKAPAATRALDGTF